MPKILLDENTKIGISLVTLLAVIGFIITATFVFTTWKTKAEATDLALALQIESLSIDNDKQDLRLEKLESATMDISVSVKAIETDVKWLRLYMEDSKK